MILPLLSRSNTDPFLSWFTYLLNDTICLMTKENTRELTTTERIRLVNQLVQTNLGITPKFSEDRSTGYSGNVYVVEGLIEGRKQKLVVKLTPFEEESVLELESVSRRVYSTKFSNFNPAHQLLVDKGFSVAKIYAQGDCPETCYHYQIVSYLEGVSIREALEDKNTPACHMLHEVTGEVFGLLHHKGTRSYDGWVAQEKPYLLPWKSAVEQALMQQLKSCQELNSVVRELPIKTFIEHKLSLWSDPLEFVLSDIDGFQGMAKYENGKWEFTGLIDIEDHKFCDPRMVLAGYEVALYYEDLKVPPEFWRGYKKYKQIDANYDNLRPLFELYYLMSWLQIPYEGHERVAKDQIQPVIRKFEQLIANLIKDN